MMRGILIDGLPALGTRRLVVAGRFSRHQPAIHSTLRSILRNGFAKAIPGCMTLAEHRRARDGGPFHRMNELTENHGYRIPVIALRSHPKGGRWSISTYYDPRRCPWWKRSYRRFLRQRSEAPRKARQSNSLRCLKIRLFRNN